MRVEEFMTAQAQSFSFFGKLVTIRGAGNFSKSSFFA